MPQFFTRNLFRYLASKKTPQKSDYIKVSIGKEEFPTNLEEYINLETVQLLNFPIDNLPNALTQLSMFPKITEYVISYTGEEKDLYGIPEEIGRCTNLKYLIVSGMFGIPQSLVLCKELELVNINSDIYYEEFPEVFFHLPNIKEVDILAKKKEQQLDPQWVESAVSRIKQCCNESIFYTHHGNVILNSELRSGHIPNFLRFLYDSMINGQISVKGSLISNDKLHLYRGIQPEYVENLVPGDIVHDDGFSSFTISPEIAVMFSNLTNPYIIDIEYDGNALFLGHKDLSYHSGEKEFVIGPQTSLEIIKIDKIFVNIREEEWKPTTRLSVKLTTNFQALPLNNSDELENILNDLFTQSNSLTNQRTKQVYNIEKLRNKLQNREFSKKGSTLSHFIIEYLDGNIVAE